MGKRFGVVPAEVRVQASLDGLAPQFRAALEATVRDVRAVGHAVRIFETLRTAERQKFLHGFGRLYDDGRGVVTHAESHLRTWHGFGLAADLVEDDKTPWNATPAFWNAIGVAAERHGLVWGGRWKFIDLPHIQWGGAPRSPTDNHRFVLGKSGAEAVWRLVGAA